MTKIAMLEPMAYLYKSPAGHAVSIRKYEGVDLAPGVIRYDLVPTDQAEAYADARVRESMQWVSVTDRLPEIIENYPGSVTGVSIPVLVLLSEENDDGSRIDVWRCFRGGRGDTTSIYWDWEHPRVTHWMLPPPQHDNE